jgi:hypothetical protein
VGDCGDDTTTGPSGLRRAPPESRWPASGNAVQLKNFDDYLERVLGFR